MFSTTGTIYPYSPGQPANVAARTGPGILNPKPPVTPPSEVTLKSPPPPPQTLYKHPKGTQIFGAAGQSGNYGVVQGPANASVGPIHHLGHVAPQVKPLGSS